MKLFLWWFDRVIKTKGWWILPCQPHTGKIIFIPLNEVTFGGWGLARRNTQTGVFFPVQQEVKQKSLLLSYIIFSSLQSVDRDARISTQRGTGRNPHSWEGGRERKEVPDFSWKKPTKIWVTFSLPCWECLTRTKESIPWMMEVMGVL